MIVRIKGVKPVRSKGRVYYYHRATGERINLEPGTDAFLAEVKRLDATPGADRRPAPGSLDALIASFKSDDNPEWANYAPDTRIWYERIFDYLQPIGPVLLAEIDTPYLMKVRAKCFKKHGRRFANGVISGLGTLFKWAIPNGWMETNPAAAVPTIRRKKGEKKHNRPWTPDETEIAFAALTGVPSGNGLLVGVTLGYWCGLSVFDIVTLPRKGAYVPATRTLTYGRHKTEEGTTVTVAPEAAAILDAELTRLADAKIQPRSLVVNNRDRPFTRSGFKASFYKLIRELVALEMVGPGLSLHGLRHTMGKDIVDAGGDEADTAATLAQNTNAMGRHYSKQRDRAARAKRAIDKVIKLRRRRKQG